MQDPHYYWKGNSIEEIYRGVGAYEFPALPTIQYSDTHKVLFELPINTGEDEPPKPHAGKRKWDSDHVRMPYAEQNTMEIDGEEKIRWDVIETALLQPIKSTTDLEKAILTYNPKYTREWRFHALHRLFESLHEKEVDSFFDEVLPAIIRLALQLPTLIPNAIPLMKRGKSCSLSMSQQQVACLLANAFLCTFPRRNTNDMGAEYGSYPHINFAHLYVNKYQNSVIEKITCIINYFRRVCKKMPCGVMTFHRSSKSMASFPNWSKAQQTFSPSMLMHVTGDGTIEEGGYGMLQVDFANKYLGGGVLGAGCVQEEIRFVICPELLCSMLFAERMDANEAFFMMGCEQFSSYKGYGSTFEFLCDYDDDTPRDRFRRRICTIVAIDATPFRAKAQQYEEKCLVREVNKAFVGFHHTLHTPAPAVATGNWGCGAFNGDKNLKSLLQLIACCITNRPLVYYAFGDVTFCDDFEAIFKYLTENRIKIGDLWCWLVTFKSSKHRSDELYKYIIQKHRDQTTKSSQSSSETLDQAPGSSTTNNDNGAAQKIEPTNLSDVDAFFAELGEQLGECDELEKKHRESKNFASSIKTSLTSLGEVPEKRNHRSLIDCLDQSYVEKPSKIKRESTPQPWLGEYDQIIDNLKKPESENVGDSEESDQNGNAEMTDELAQSLDVLKESINRQNDSGDAEKLKNETNDDGNDDIVDDHQDSDGDRMQTDDSGDGKEISSPSTSSKTPPHDKNQKKIAEFFKAVPKKLASDETDTK